MSSGHPAIILLEGLLLWFQYYVKPVKYPNTLPIPFIMIQSPSISHYNFREDYLLWDPQIPSQHCLKP